MKKDEEPESPSWSASFLMQTTEDVAKAVAAAAAAIGSPRPSVVYSSKDESSGSQLNKFQHTVSRILKGLSTPPEIRGGSYNPEVLTSQKRQWAHIQLQTLDHRVWKDPTKLFESMVVVGLPPSSDVQALQNLYFSKKSDSPGRLRNALGGQHQSRIEPNLEPQVLFVYPPEKQLPLKYKDLLSFCFPAGVEVNAVEKTPSMSELNEILIGQEHLKQRDLSFVFRLQVADASTLYGCCVLVEEMIQKPSRLISTVSDVLPFRSGLSRHSLTTRRCYCILTRVPFFELHFGVLNSIFMEERLERLTKQVSKLNYEHSLSYDMPEISEEESGSSPPVDGGINMQNGTVEASQSSSSGSIPGSIFDDISQPEHQNLNRDSYSKKEPNDNVVPPDTEVGKLVSIPGSISDGISLPEHQNLIRDSYSKKEPYANVVPPDTEVGKLVSIPGSIFEGISLPEHQNLIRDSYSKKLPNGNVVPPDTEVGKLVSSEEQLVDYPVNDDLTKKKLSERRPPSVVPPFLRFQQCESSESSSSFQGSSSEDRHFRSDLDSAETEEASSSGRYNLSEHSDILEWAKANNHGSLQIICEYYQLCCPARGSTIKFHPLDHLHPLEYHRPDETVLHDAGLRIDLRSCNTSLEFAEAHSALMVEEEAAALSVWSVACLCGSLRLEHVLTLFAAALLEKQILVVCSNLGVLSAIVLSVIPLIRPYQWQSWLMPVLPNDMLDFLDAPVPYIVGVKNKTNEVQSKLSNVVLVDANRNQVKSPTIPQLPQQKELISSLSSYHAKLVGESYLGKKRPVYECTDVQAEAAKGFLGVLRSYLDSLCSNIRSHTITNVQSNDDKVSLLLKESFIESYPSRDQPFMKLLVDTQLFSVHTDFVLSYFQKE